MGIESDLYPEVRRLNAENKRLREALEFYADLKRGGYVARVTCEITPLEVRPTIWFRGEIIMDGGHRAKQALATTQSPASVESEKPVGDMLCPACATCEFFRPDTDQGPCVAEACERPEACTLEQPSNAEQKEY